MECKPISTPTEETEIATEEAVIVIDGIDHEEESIGGRINEELICIMVP